MNNFMLSSRYKQRALTLSVLLSISAMQSAVALPSALSDSELREVDAQALINLSYLAPTDDGSNSSVNGNVGFYRLGIEADLEINANIKKLQLGCGGVNGPDACDIDIDNLQLSGGVGGVELNGDGSVKLGVDGLPIPLTDRETRAGSSAKLTNPFIEFAFKNADSASTREMVGLRVSAEAAKGLLTLGDENSTTPNGINSLSGYLQVQSNPGISAITGVLDTKPGYLDIGWFYDNQGLVRSDGSVVTPLKGQAQLKPLGYTITVQFDATRGGFWIPGVTDVPFYAPLDTIRGIKADGSLTSTAGKVNGNRIVGLQVFPNRVNLPNAVLGYDESNASKELNGFSCALLGNTSCNQFGVTNGFVGPDAYTYYEDPVNGFTFVGDKTSVPAAFQGYTNNCGGGSGNKADPNSCYYQPSTAVANALKTQGGVTLKPGGTAAAPNIGGVAGFGNSVGVHTTGCQDAVLNVGCTVTGAGNTNIDYVKMFGLITGLFADVTFEEPLGMIHSLTVDSPLSLSLQKQELRWPGANDDDIAQTGWWLSLADPVYVGDLLPSEAIDLCPGGLAGPVNRCAYPQFISQANDYFTNTAAQGGDAIAAVISNSQTNPFAVKISTAAGLALPNGFQLTLKDVQLATQQFAPNCYGDLTFC